MNKSIQPEKAYFGGCSPGDVSHSFMCNAVSARRAPLRISWSRSIPGGGCRGLLFEGVLPVPSNADLVGRYLRNGVVP